MDWEYEKSRCAFPNSSPGSLLDKQEMSRRLVQTVGAGASCGPTPSTGELFNILEEQEKETHRLNEMVELLTARLRPVLLPDQSDPVQPSSIRSYGSPLANIVQTNTLCLAESCRRIESIIKLLAL